MAPLSKLITTSSILISIISQTNAQLITCSTANPCSCPSNSSLAGPPCILDCDTDNSCNGKTLYCRPNDRCLIQCTATSSCSTSNIITQNSTDVILACNGLDSCKDLTIDTSNVLSFKCIGDCPISLTNLEFSSSPTATPTNSPTTPTIAPSRSPLPNGQTYPPTLNPVSTIIEAVITDNPTVNPTEPTPMPTPNPVEPEQEEVLSVTSSGLAEFTPHPLYYIIASLLVLICIVCSALFCWVYASHNRTQKMILQQQRRLNSKSYTNFYRNDTETHDDMIGRHGHHGKSTSFYGISSGNKDKIHEPYTHSSKSPSLDIKYASSSDGAVRSPTATQHSQPANPRMYRLHSADATAIANKAVQLTSEHKLSRHKVNENQLKAAQRKETSLSKDETSASGSDEDGSHLKETWEVEFDNKDEEKDGEMTVTGREDDMTMDSLMIKLMKMHEANLSENNRTSRTSLPGDHGHGHLMYTHPLYQPPYNIPQAPMATMPKMGPEMKRLPSDTAATNSITIPPGAIRPNPRLRAGAESVQIGLGHAKMGINKSVNVHASSNSNNIPPPPSHPPANNHNKAQSVNIPPPPPPQLMQYGGTRSASGARRQISTQNRNSKPVRNHRGAKFTRNQSMPNPNMLGMGPQPSHSWESQQIVNNYHYKNGLFYGWAAALQHLQQLSLQTGTSALAMPSMPAMPPPGPLPMRANSTPQQSGGNLMSSRSGHGIRGKYLMPSNNELSLTESRSRSRDNYTHTGITDLSHTENNRTMILHINTCDIDSGEDDENDGDQNNKNPNDNDQVTDPEQEIELEIERDGNDKIQIEINDDEASNEDDARSRSRSETKTVNSGNMNDLMPYGPRSHAIVDMGVISRSSHVLETRSNGKDLNSLAPSSVASNGAQSLSDGYDTHTMTSKGNDSRPQSPEQFATSPESEAVGLMIQITPDHDNALSFTGKDVDDINVSKSDSQPPIELNVSQQIPDTKIKDMVTDIEGDEVEVEAGNANENDDNKEDKTVIAVPKEDSKTAEKDSQSDLSSTPIPKEFKTAPDSKNTENSMGIQLVSDDNNDNKDEQPAMNKVTSTSTVIEDTYLKYLNM